jgi:hypothetical protein
VTLALLGQLLEHLLATFLHRALSSGGELQANPRLGCLSSALL